MPSDKKTPLKEQSVWCFPSLQNKSLHSTLTTFLDGANGTGKTSTLKRCAMELKTGFSKQRDITAHDYWYGTDPRYDNDFGIVTIQAAGDLYSDITPQELNDGELQQFMIEKVNTINSKLKKPKAPES